LTGHLTHLPSPATRARPEFVRLSTASVTEANSAPLSASSWRVMNRPRIEWSGVIPPHTHMHSRSLRVSRSSPRSELIPLIRPNSTTPAISHGAYPRRPTGLYCPSNALQSCSLRISRSTRASRSPISRRCTSRRCIPMRISRGSGSSKRIPPRGASTCTGPHPGSLSNSSKPSCVPCLDPGHPTLDLLLLHGPTDFIDSGQNPSSTAGRGFRDTL
jgi:hypothetical protein